MNEMLANQYFMGRNFIEAENYFSILTKNYPENHIFKKKLIICMIENKKIDIALNLFSEIIFKDIRVITDTDLIKDDCPCPEIIKKINEIEKNSLNLFELYVSLGMLWLYCDTENSRKYLKLAFQEQPDNQLLRKIIYQIDINSENKNPH